MSVTSGHITQALRLAAAGVEGQTGIPFKKISAISLRSGGATALLCARIDTDTIKLLGRWRSDAVEKYLRTNAHTVTEGYSSTMVQKGSYRFHTAPEILDTLPDLLPDTNVDDDIRDAYLHETSDFSEL